MNGVIQRSDPEDEYDLLQRVGRGTYGDVYKARHIRTGNLSAVKLVKLEAGDNFAVIQQEIMVLKDCVHANIIAYHGSYLKRDRLWIVMEYCSGGSLQDIYQMTGPLTELQIAFVCRETLKGLDYLHRRGKIHRDVKGANILLTHSGDIKLADFGVAAQITATLGKRNSFIGTPYWMAPEVAQVEQRGGYGCECDVWAVGITAIELAELQPPHFDLHPMQVLQMMTKSSYKAPKLKDKAKWSSTFHSFVKHCLVKNPKKRPVPDKLLNQESFVSGALSPRLTRELLDRVNNPSTPRSEEENSHLLSDAIETALYNGNEDIYNGRRPSTPSTVEDSDIQQISQSYHNGRTIPARGDDVSIAGSDIPWDESSTNEASANGRQDTLRPLNFNGLPPTPRNGIAKPPASKQFGRKFFRFGEAFRPEFRLNKGRSASLDEMSPNSTGRPLSSDNGVVRHRPTLAGQTPLASRPFTCYGLVPTPQVSMGACFFNVYHNCQLRINCTASWTHPANNKQYLIIGAEEGIYTLDLTELQDSSLTLIHERRCGWIYIIENHLFALQGKTPYLYQHNILQLVQQQMITQRISKTMTKIPEKLKPRVLLATVRQPETKDCFQCCIQKSVVNRHTFMACAIPGSVLLFQWYEPLQKFVLMKSVSVDRMMMRPIRPFCLLYGCPGNPTSEFPKVCIGVYKNEESPTKLDLQMIDFNDTGKLEDFLARSQNAELFDGTLRPLTGRVFNWSNKQKIEVTAFRQIDRDTLFVAYENKVILTDLEGQLKSTDLWQTTFTFDFQVDYALPLPDSVLAFHKSGIQGKSFFKGNTTQDINQPVRTFQVIGDDSLVVLKSRVMTLPRSTADSDEENRDSGNGGTLTPSTSSSSPGTPMAAAAADAGTDLCILTGHVSTLSPP